jgi:Tuberculosis necrotizing toxin
MSEISDSGSAVETADSTAEVSGGSAGGETAAEPGEGKPAVPPASDGYYIGGLELEADIAKTQKLQAGTEVANSGGSGEAVATGGAKTGGDSDSKASGDGKAGAGQDAAAESTVEAGRGSAGGETAAEPGEGKPAVPPASDGYFIGGSEVEKAVRIQELQKGLEAHRNNPNTQDQFPDGYDPFHGDTPEQYLNKYASGVDIYGRPNWNWSDPGKHGAVEGLESRVQLSPGQVLDRYGDGRGHYMCLSGTSYPERSLPAHSLAEKYHQYKVARPFTVNAGEAAEAFGEPGRGIQLRTDQTISKLVKDGYLEEVRL